MLTSRSSSVANEAILYAGRTEVCLCRNNRANAPAQLDSTTESDSFKSVSFQKESCAVSEAAGVYPAGVCEAVVYWETRCYGKPGSPFLFELSADLDICSPRYH